MDRMKSINVKSLFVMASVSFKSGNEKAKTIENEVKNMGHGCDSAWDHR